MKSFWCAYAAGGMSVLGIWLAYTNKQKIDTMMKNIATKTEQMLQDMKKSSNCTCGENNASSTNN